MQLTVVRAAGSRGRFEGRRECSVSPWDPPSGRRRLPVVSDPDAKPGMRNPAYARLRRTQSTRADMLKRSDLPGDDRAARRGRRSARDGRSYPTPVSALPRSWRRDRRCRCAIGSGRREVVSCPAGRLGAADRECFDRFFFEHPLVRYHGVARGPGAHRISDSIPFARFRNGALYCEYSAGSASTTRSPCRCTSTTAARELRPEPEQA